MNNRLIASLDTPLKLFRLWSICVVLISFNVMAQSPRFLFVVDTSSAASKSAPTARNAVYDIILSGMGHQAKPGDRVALWTFSSTVETEALRPFNWQEDQARRHASEALALLAQTRYRGRKNLGRVIESIKSMASTTELVTVFLISDGRSKISGTAFDETLNDIYTKNYREMTRMERPFVTSLVIYRGEYIAWSVDAGGGDINVPLFVPEESPTVADSSAGGSEPPSTQESGKRPEAGSGQSVSTAKNAGITRSPANGRSRENSSNTAQPQPQTPQGKPSTKSTEIVVAPPPGKAPAREKPTDAGENQAKASEPEKAVVEQPAIVVAEDNQEGEISPKAKETIKQSGTGRIAETNVVAVAKKPSVEKSVGATTTGNEPSVPSKTIPTPAPSSTSSVKADQPTTKAVAPSGTGSSSQKYLWLGIAFAVGSISFGLWIVLRSKAPRKGTSSLITQSMGDRSSVKTAPR